MKLWLVRHAQPLIPLGVCYGATDVAAASRRRSRRLAPWPRYCRSVFR